MTFKSESSAVSALQSPPLMRDKRLVVKPRNLKPRPQAGAAVMEVDEPRYSIPVSDEVIDLVGRADRVSAQHWETLTHFKPIWRTTGVCNSFGTC